MIRFGQIRGLFAILMAAVILAACGGEAANPLPIGGGGGGDGLGTIDLGLGSNSLSGNAGYTNWADDSGITVGVIADDTVGQPVIGSTTTGSAGTYNITGLPDTGNFTVVASSPSSLEQAVVAAISMPQATIADLGLTGTGSVSGSVALLDIPITGLVFIPGTSYLAISASDGSFTLTGVPAGSWDVVVSLFGADQENTVSAVSVAVGANTALPAADTTLAPGFSIFGGLIAMDFTESALHPFPFKERDHIRRLNGLGQAEIRLTATEPRERIYLQRQQAAPAESWGVAADVKVTEYWSEDPSLIPAAEVGGVFFSEGFCPAACPPPVPAINNFYAVARIVAGYSGRDLRAEAALYACDWSDWACENRRELVRTDLATGIAFDQNVNLQVSCDLGVSLTAYECTFSATVGAAAPATATLSFQPFGATFTAEGFRERFVGMTVLKQCCDEQGGGGDEFFSAYGHIEGTFDNVEMAGAATYPGVFSPYDALEGTTLDKTKWRTESLESRNEVFAGQVVYDRRIVSDAACPFCFVPTDVFDFNVEGFDGKRYNHVQGDFSLHPTLSSVPSATNAVGTVHHGVGGALFNDGTGLIGDAGNVMALVSLRTPNSDAGTPSWSVGYNVWYCDDLECRPGVGQIPVHSGTLAVFSSVTDAYRLSMDWDEGANLVLTATNLTTLATASATVDPTAAGAYPVVQPALSWFKGAFAGIMDFESTASEDFRIAGALDNFIAY